MRTHPNQLSFNFLNSIRDQRSSKSVNRMAALTVHYSGPMAYLKTLINRDEPLIHLWGENPHICQVLSLASDEPVKAKTGAWVYRKEAIDLLMPIYYFHGYLVMDGRKAEIWRKNRESGLLSESPGE